MKNGVAAGGVPGLSFLFLVPELNAFRSKSTHSLWGGCTGLHYGRINHPYGWAGGSASWHGFFLQMALASRNKSIYICSMMSVSHGMWNFLGMMSLSLLLFQIKQKNLKLRVSWRWAQLSSSLCSSGHSLQSWVPDVAGCPKNDQGCCLKWTLLQLTPSLPPSLSLSLLWK